jgi:uncharacterized protein YjbI with pentapeptide repeats
MMSAGRSIDEESIASVLAAARREILDLVIAVGAIDDDGAAMASSRLRWAMTAAEHLAATQSISPRSITSTQLASVREQANRWLSNDPRMLTADAVERLLTRIEHRRSHGEPCIDATNAELDGLDLDDLDLSKLWLRGANLNNVTGRRALLDVADATGASLRQCQLCDSSLSMATFDESTLVECDLSRANLERATWHHTSITRCTLAGAELTDARFDGTVFIDCNLRGAALGIVKLARRATTAATQFVRCDLRETGWRGRDLAGVTFVDCKLYGAHGDPKLDRVVIERPDLSPAADGSQVGTRSDVIAGWSTVVGARSVR